MDGGERGSLPPGRAVSITVIRGPDTGTKYEFHAPKVVLGRKRGDVVLKDREISGVHASIEYAPDGRFIVKDLGSTNGTFLDGRKITVAEIKSGQHVRVGANHLLFTVVEESVGDTTRQSRTAITGQHAAADSLDPFPESPFGGTDISPVRILDLPQDAVFGMEPAPAAPPAPTPAPAAKGAPLGRDLDLGDPDLGSIAVGQPPDPFPIDPPPAPRPAVAAPTRPAAPATSPSPTSERRPSGWPTGEHPLKKKESVPPPSVPMTSPAAVPPASGSGWTGEAPRMTPSMAPAPPLPPATPVLSNWSLEEALVGTGSLSLGAVADALEVPSPRGHVPDEPLPEGVTRSVYGIYLVVERGRDKGKVFPVNRQVTVLGRSGTEILINDPDISRRHAALDVQGEGKYILRDLASTNGTLLNGISVQTENIAANDKIRMGSTSIKFVVGDGQVAADLRRIDSEP